MTELRTYLREGTSSLHDRVDSAFSRFSLTEAQSYGAFLTAHAAVLVDAERLADAASLYPDAAPRVPLLDADLRDMGLGSPRPGASGLEANNLSEAERWGMLYVLEGSRLGGGLLSGRVGAGLPRRYLSARHAPGAWRGFLAALEAAPGATDGAWRADALAGATRLFQAFELAALNRIGTAFAE